eukprot:Skav219868  [mRNA]  locus=scaffold777:40601:42924:+ [translate_table: standard]
MRGGNQPRCLGFVVQRSCWILKWSAKEWRASATNEEVSSAFAKNGSISLRPRISADEAIFLYFPLFEFLQFRWLKASLSNISRLSWQKVRKCQQPRSAQHSAREPRDALKTAGSQVGTILALGSTGKTSNLLLVRDDAAVSESVERPKPSCFNLPDHQFSYGRPGNQDSEGLNALGWTYSKQADAGARTLQMPHHEFREDFAQAEEPDFMSVNRTPGMRTGSNREKVYGD